jgi:hypothetical protein
MGKFTAVKDGNSIHVIPALDVIVHACSGSCPCKPTTEKREGSDESIFTHHSAFSSGRF